MKTPEAVGFREDEDGVDMVLGIGTDHALRMIIPAEAAIEWGRQLMMLGAAVQERTTLTLMRQAVATADSRSVWCRRDWSGNLDS